MPATPDSLSNTPPELLHGPGLGAEKRLPPIAKRAVNFFRAMGRMLAAGDKRVPEAVYESRLTVCDGCEWRGGRDGKYCTHADCGCNLLEKAALRTEDCPVGKWPNA